MANSSIPMVPITKAGGVWAHFINRRDRDVRCSHFQSMTFIPGEGPTRFRKHAGMERPSPPLYIA
jgi:hypothetical protein